MSALNGRSVDAARREVTARLKAAGLESPELDARLLIGAALDLDHTELLIQAARTLTREETVIVEKYLARRIAHEPVAHILGFREFWGLNFLVSNATLIPRPDTETVVSAALDYLRDCNKVSDDIRIADFGTGSGAILLALLSECPNARGIGVDVSAEALAIAAANARNLGLDRRADFIRSNYGTALAEPFDLIVSNPPYIPSKDIDDLEIDVRDYEPHLALDGGRDGLDAYRIIAPQAASLLAAKGALIVEVGYDQSEDVSQMMRAAGLTISRPPRADFGGVDRVVTGIKQAL